MKKHSILMLIAAILFGVTATSCDDYLDVNKNVDAPDHVDGYLYLAGIQQGYYDIYADNHVTNVLTQMWGTSSSTYGTFRDHSWYAGSDSGGAIWRMVYWEQGMNLENMINQSIEAEDWHLAGIGLIMKAYSWDVLTKYHGEAILRQAFDTSLLSFDYQYQDEIYASIRKWALEGIKYLEMEDNTLLKSYIAGNDYIYGGDIDKWKKFGYYVMVRNLASLTRKKDFKEKYYNDLVNYAALAFASSEDDAEVSVAGGGGDAAYSSYNNYWGIHRGNLGNTYWQYDWAVQVMTGTVPKYDANWSKITSENETWGYELAEKQIVTDINVDEEGHWDPRMAVKLSTTMGNDQDNYPIEDIRHFVYYGGSASGSTGIYGDVANFWGVTRSYSVTTARFGDGRWLFNNNAPYILGTYAEMMFDVAEAHFVAGDKTKALDAFKKAVAGDMDFTARHIVTGKVVDGWHQGDKITKAQFNTAAAEYLAGPFVGGLTEGDLTLSHIMMQKFVALYPWGSQEAWVDQRKYHYDIVYSNEYPTIGNGWDFSTIKQKRDEDDVYTMDDIATGKVFKGYYLAPSEVRGGSYGSKNQGSPCYRIRPRYNSEYVWNEHKLKELKPISGVDDAYITSKPWFSYPGNQPDAPIYAGE